MNYEEAMSVIVTKEEARREIAKHGKNTPEITFEAFVAEYGDHEWYEGEDVLNWLGY